MNQNGWRREETKQTDQKPKTAKHRQKSSLYAVMVRRGVVRSSKEKHSVSYVYENPPYNGPYHLLYEVHHRKQIHGMGFLIHEHKREVYDGGVRRGGGGNKKDRP